MANKNNMPPIEFDLDEELKEYLEGLNKQNPSGAVPLAKISGKMLSQSEQKGVIEISDDRSFTPTPKVIKSVVNNTYNEIIKSISPNRSHGLDRERGRTEDRSSIVQMAVEFEAEYGQEARRLLNSMVHIYEAEDRLDPGNLKLTIELLKIEFLEKISLRDREKAIEMLLMMKPENLNVMEFNQLLTIFVQWFRMTRPILIDTFLKLVFSEREHDGDELRELSVHELDQIRRLELIDLLKKFNDVIKRFGYEVGNNFMRTYFDQGQEEAERYLRFLNRL